MKKTLLALSFIFVSTMLFSCPKNDSFDISVMLTTGEGYTVTSENPISIKSGEDAVFDIELWDGYKLIQVLPADSDYSFDGDSITFRGIEYPKTVELYASKGTNNYRFSLQNLSGGGIVSSSTPTGRIHEGTRISVSATPKRDYEFLGWSLDKTLSNGGELVSDNLQYSFVLSKNTTVHANFKNAAPPVVDNATKPSAVLTEQRIMIYHPNGGYIKDSEDAFYTSESSDKYFLMPNTIPGANEILKRDGYKLIGFSDKPDGSGRFYGIGHTARFAEEKKLPTSFYCVWQPYSDLSYFTYEPYKDGITITGYSGNEETVTVPEIIDGKKVIKIAKGAISGDNIKVLMLPYCLLYADEGAIFDCPKLEKVHMSDAIRKFPDSAFSETAKFKLLHLDAAIAPAFSNYYRNFAIKYQYLRSLPNDRPKLVILSGSNTDHGVDTLTMEKAFKDKYYCVNFGTDAAFNITFFLETVANMLSENDIIVHNFEQMDYCRGTLEINAMSFQGLESNLDVVSQVDFSRYNGFFDALCEFNDKMRGNLIGGSYNSNPNVHNKRGEKLSIQPEYNKDSFHSGANGDFHFSDKVISLDEAKNLSELYRDIRAKGVTVLISYPSFNYNAIVKENRNEASYASYDRFIRDNIDAPLISKVSDYIFKGKYMSNTDYHLNEHGRKIRTARLLRDIAAYTGDAYTPINISGE